MGHVPGRLTPRPEGESVDRKARAGSSGRASNRATVCWVSNNLWYRRLTRRRSLQRVSVQDWVLEMGCTACIDLTGGYCWSTPRCRNLGVQDAVSEGKKAEETSPRKSTLRTLRQVDQQYPGGYCWSTPRMVLDDLKKEWAEALLPERRAYGV